MAQIKAAEYVVRFLEQEHVEYVFGVIGSAVLDIADYLYQRGAVKCIWTQHEQGAAAMAHGYARATGEPGVCLVTVGPGATNTYSCVAQAFVLSTPVVIISGEISREIYHKGPANFHEIDQTACFKPVTKMSERVEHGSRLPEALRKAFRVCQAGRPGPVYIGIPRDVQRDLISDELWPVSSYRPSAPPAPNADTVKAAADILLAANRVGIIAGGGTATSGAVEAVMDLAAAIPAVVASTTCRVVPDDHPLALGEVGKSGAGWRNRFFQRCDVVLAIGTWLGQNATRDYGRSVIAENARILQVDIDPEVIGANYPVECGIVADAKETALALVREIRGRAVERTGEMAVLVRELAEARTAFRASLDTWAKSIKGLSRLHLIDAVREVFSEDDLVTYEAGSNQAWGAFALPVYHPIIHPGDFGTMGTGFCMAMGAQLAMPDHRVINLTGDGAFMMTLPELATAMHYNIPVICIIANNGIYGNVKNTQWKQYGGRYTGVDLPVPNFAQVARAFGVHGERAQTAEELVSALRRAAGVRRPAVIEVMLSRELEDQMLPRL